MKARGTAKPMIASTALLLLGGLLLTAQEKAPIGPDTTPNGLPLRPEEPRRRSPRHGPQS